MLLLSNGLWILSVKDFLNWVTPKHGVEAAVERQRERYKGTDIRFNSRIPASRMEEFCPLGRKEEKRLEEIFQKLELSTRAYHKILKVARTLADLEGCPVIGIRHLNEAVCFRSIDKKYWIR